ncbi:hypothetical protein B4135_2635 [Caldibacillus debilis]|uniref:Uncharacterized protein n=1 Tax=Caldibacillus debilis TaxID=301148 RepID=A0A150LVH2_9BACI|nr:hypothetical protein B4135_2635 [Caldibacillus debilis]
MGVRGFKKDRALRTVIIKRSTVGGPGRRTWIQRMIGSGRC